MYSCNNSDYISWSQRWVHHRLSPKSSPLPLPSFSSFYWVGRDHLFNEMPSRVVGSTIYMYNPSLHNAIMLAKRERSIPPFFFSSSDKNRLKIIKRQKKDQKKGHPTTHLSFTHSLSLCIWLMCPNKVIEKACSTTTTINYWVLSSRLY